MSEDFYAFYFYLNHLKQLFDYLVIFSVCIYSILDSPSQYYFLNSHSDTVFSNICWQRQCIKRLIGSSVNRVAQEKERVGLCPFLLAAIIHSLKPMCLHVPWKKTNEFYFLHWWQFELSTGSSDAIGIWFIMPTVLHLCHCQQERGSVKHFAYPHPWGWKRVHTKKNKLIMQIIHINNQYIQFIQAISWYVSYYNVKQYHINIYSLSAHQKDKIFQGCRVFFVTINKASGCS